MTIDEIKKRLKSPADAETIAELYAAAHEAYWECEDGLYDYEFGSEDYLEANEEVERWQGMLGKLAGRVEKLCEEENKPYDLEKFMDEQGYELQGSLWVKG